MADAPGNAASPLAAPPVDLDALTGRQIGHFRVDALLGRGGMGAVYRAWDLHLERSVALKTVLFESPATRTLFFREARAQAKLRHPHVVPIHFVGEHEGLTYLVMELVDGESLFALIRRVGRLSERRALDIVDAVASALEAAHAQGLIHRDIKPSNVLVETTGRVLLADFGLAKATGVAQAPTPAPPGNESGSGSAGSVPVTQAGAIIGTPAYLAPELTSGARSGDHRADMYALGVTLYELVTGEPPFTAPTDTRLATAHQKAPVVAPRVIVPSIRLPVEALVLRLLAKSPSDRFATYAELRQAVAAARARPILLAPFLSRAGALVIDLTVMLSLLVVLVLVFGKQHASVTAPLGLFVGMLPFALAESTWGTTIGKRLMGLETVNLRGDRLSFARSLARVVSKLWGLLLAMVLRGVEAVVLFVAGQASTSGGSRSWVGIANLTLIVIWLGGFLLALGRRHAALHDRITRSQVVSNVKPELDADPTDPKS